MGIAAPFLRRNLSVYETKSHLNRRIAIEVFKAIGSAAKPRHATRYQASSRCDEQVVVQPRLRGLAGRKQHRQPPFGVEKDDLERQRYIHRRRCRGLSRRRDGGLHCRCLVEVDFRRCGAAASVPGETLLAFFAPSCRMEIPQRQGRSNTNKVKKVSPGTDTFRLSRERPGV